MTTETGITLCNIVLAGCACGVWLIGMIALRYGYQDYWIDPPRRSGRRRIR